MFEITNPKASLTAEYVADDDDKLTLEDGTVIHFENFYSIAIDGDKLFFDRPGTLNRAPRQDVSITYEEIDGKVYWCFTSYFGTAKSKLSKPSATQLRPKKPAPLSRTISHRQKQSADITREPSLRWSGTIKVFGIPIFSFVSVVD